MLCTLLTNRDDGPGSRICNAPATIIVTWTPSPGSAVKGIQYVCDACSRQWIGYKDARQRRIEHVSSVA
jgi:hypothetical protein